MTTAVCTSLYQVNTRVWLTALSESLGRRATLDDIPDSELDRLAALGLEWIWLLSVWRVGEAGKRVSRIHPDLLREYNRVLADLRMEDIGGSGFAIAGYTVSANLGGGEALSRLRMRMAKRNLRLMLDFVPNHTALDHPWAETHPEYYVTGTEADLQRAPGSYIRLKTSHGDAVLAHGRDPHFPAWSDTLQLDYCNPSTLKAMQVELQHVAELCDGVRCDMAMLVMPEIFERTWGRRPEAFWPAAIQQVREKHPGFSFLAEVYWDLESTLLEQGFDFAYDKRLYDFLVEKNTPGVRHHLRTRSGCLGQLAHFLENHDEARAAAMFPLEVHQAAAVVTYLTPGLRFFQQGQFEGWKNRVPAQLVRAPQEPVDEAVRGFYDRLLALLRRPHFREGTWTLPECVPAGDGNKTVDNLLAYSWEVSQENLLLVLVNYADRPSQCFVRLPAREFCGRMIRLKDLLGPATYDRDGSELVSSGLFVDMAPWAVHVFELSRLPDFPALSVPPS